MPTEKRSWFRRVCPRKKRLGTRQLFQIPHVSPYILYHIVTSLHIWNLFRNYRTYRTSRRIPISDHVSLIELQIWQNIVDALCLRFTDTRDTLGFTSLYLHRWRIMSAICHATQTFKAAYECIDIQKNKVHKVVSAGNRRRTGVVDGEG